ncbi:prepilin-type N-terminal cleavage/methylation domain-containing protein [Dactylococcopsis salina]|uniref:Prepilin-type N-terminal cleavage/methylation domain-containing protein n=1 Tax=Dactylococcopsis salina (strain PCC 8305) TaxID=13035 RepID=K9YYS5_DACS8|nr:prepilin-type N-terminal cleavage/methylation domain-containing protein [Dactylococcopsis salina]AFZ51637.1 prepilin-type N-terminal cleavage/methylation domain-containing protein [Dactylococcopsis salina PCC 8305]
MKTFLHKFLTHLNQKKNRLPFSLGFTLIELLIATVMSSIVISSLLYLMLNVMQTNAKETARKDTLQEMQVALNFMTNDLREAVYVYTGEELDDRGIDTPNDGLKDIMNLPNSGNLEPILVFWKLEDAPYQSSDSFPSDCSAASVEASERTCDQLKISRRTYTLVAYLQDSDPTDTWQGESVIYRYQLRKYNSNPFNTLEKKPEYIDPVKESSFASWPYDDTGSLPNSGSYTLTVNRGSVGDGGKSDALVDFVDRHDNSNFSATDVSCPTGYQRTPSDASVSNSFYACVEDVSGQKTVTVYLRGNPDGRANVNFADGFTPLPTLQSSVVLRGANQD